MSEPDNANIHQYWSPSIILLSYLISITGSYCTIQLMENWRRVEDVQVKRLMLVLSAFALGGCGIWCTHFTGMTALDLELEDGTILEVDFELGFTILSFVFAVLGVFVGLKIASSDPYFLEMEAARRKEMLATNLKAIKMSTVVNKGAVTRRIKIIALFSRLWLIMAGGAFAALGVLGMHYMGMMAQRTNATMSFNVGIVVVSVLIAFFTANAAFWILFRALTFMPNSELLRLGSALIMGVAVCATHYCGMGAASYAPSPENFIDNTRFVLNGPGASVVASHAALLTCYWLASFSVVRNVRKAEMAASVVTQRTTGRPTASQTSVSVGRGQGKSNTQKVYVAK